MARQQQEGLTPKQAALRDLDLARTSLAVHTTLVAEEFSPRAMMSRSIERHRAAWIAGATCVGLIAIKLLLPGRRDESKANSEHGSSRSRGLLGLLMVPLMSFGRKAMMNYGSQFIQTWLASQNPSQDHERNVV